MQRARVKLANVHHDDCGDDEARHLLETLSMPSEPYRDAIGDRLDHPERVPAEYQHLIVDDRQRVTRLLEIPVSGRVLDVGCSDGAITRRLAERWPTAVFTGCDLVPAYRWREPVPTPASGFAYAYWDVRRAAVAWDRPARMHDPQQGDFDAVFCCEVLEHLTRAESAVALANIAAVLAPGGTLVVTVPNWTPHEDYVAGCRDRGRWVDHRRTWTAWDLVLALHTVGITVPDDSHHRVPLYDGEDWLHSIWLMVAGIKR